LRRSFEHHGGLEGKIILLAGDLLRGRTVRSLSKLITFFPGTKLILSSPEKFKMAEDVISFLDEKQMDYEVGNEFIKHLPEADAIYMTRVQDEHDTGSDKSEKSFPEFSLRAEHLSILKEHCAIMHPLP
jgi:aspartate carbamoyltransferase catalytic subunit